MHADDIDLYLSCVELEASDLITFTASTDMIQRLKNARVVFPHIGCGIISYV